jgi:peptidoglycan/LPS O-acetylase OafA/YrhL
VTLFETFVVGPTFYQGKLPEYFTQWAWPHLQNMFIWPQNPTIPNVFVENAHPQVNGSLWTIPIEVSFYLVLPLVVFLIGRRTAIYVVVFLTSLFLEPFATWFGLSFLNPGPSLLDGVALFHVAQYFPYFMAGLCAWKLREVIQFRTGWFVLSIIVLFAGRESAFAPIILKLCLPYVVLFIGVAGAIGTKLKKSIGDISYGTYLYAYPLTNIIVALGRRSLAPEIVFMLVTPTVLMFAYLSWRFVELPFLRMKHERDLKPVVVEFQNETSPHAV